MNFSKQKGINLHIVCIIVLSITTDAIDSFLMLYIFFISNCILMMSLHLIRFLITYSKFRQIT
ncbi:hypothetical protein UG86_12215 [Staphylococcus aureus]|uniref:Uncharacterized protein n=1 Tax=Staphylococcus aureus TaxID=1280 RepID=A0AA40JN61_STAAU|nr:hypothetical protein UG86_12215 [Staphylococcus aureus]ALO32410.1 hypothetical protein ASU36_09895 [Staphylococcus aureus]KIT74205.1 hypothetical protein QP71_11445 [Staphylococcus aureus]KIT96861.1 hypothetical protein QU38_07320 [Staphylococcus aureus]MCO4430171.1 hypothetical protein [Staphylococcus aureus]